MSVNLSEGRPQRFVPHHDPIQRSPQRLPIQFASQSQPARDVIGLARSLQLRQEPQPLLRIREFQPLAAIHHCNRRRLGLRRALDLPRKVCQDWISKEISQRDLHTQSLLQPGDDLPRQQRMASQLEEVVPAPHSLDL